jgi:kynurenine formamidase
MKLERTKKRAILAAAVAVSAVAAVAVAATRTTTREEQTKTPSVVGTSPWGPSDEIGTLNLMTDASRAAVLTRIRGGKVYDLGVEYFVGMPSWQELGDPRYQIWMTHSPHGTVVDDPLHVGADMNHKVSYTGDAVSMYTHTGTHIDALNHFGLHDKIWNGFAANDHAGDRGWNKAGAEKVPPIVARGVLLDVARARGVDELPPSYGITSVDIQAALERQSTTLQKGDVVLVRTGRMRHFAEADRYMKAPPGLRLDAARYLVDVGGAMILGGDNLSLETFPVETPDHWVPVHSWLLAERGVPIMEVVDLEQLARDKVYEFAFIAASLKLRGASGSPMRPIAIPLSR